MYYFMLLFAFIEGYERLKKDLFGRNKKMTHIKNTVPFFKNHPGLIYLDNAATTQKPQAVLDALHDFYTKHNVNLHRGIYAIAEQSTEQYEATRVQVAQFLNAQASEIVFTHGATDAMNRVAISWGYQNIQKGDEIVVTALEHHANFVPWYQLCKAKKATLKMIPVTSEGILDYSTLDTLINSKTKLVAVTQVSNAIGTHVDLAPIIKRAGQVKARVLVDGCQAAPYQKIDVKSLGCDFYVFSGHKMMGPMGVGVLYVKTTVQQECLPFPTGGGAVQEVSLDAVTFAPFPRCFEAGTPPAASVAGLSAALKVIEAYGIETIQNHCAYVTRLAIEGLEKMDFIRLLGPVNELKKSGHLISFEVKGIHAHDVAAFLDQKGIAVRAGHHCAQPLARALGYVSSLRASFYLYNSQEDVEVFLKAVAELFSK